MKFTGYIKEIWRGKDLYRILMNNECFGLELSGKVLDLGSGKNLASYHRFFKKSADLNVHTLDLDFKDNEIKGKFIDFEKTPLFSKNEEIDIVLGFNLLEHIFNYKFLVSEIERVLKPGGKFFGATPFLVGYHADPKDYWRYTSESLREIFSTAGFVDIKIRIIGRGPFSAAFSQVEFLIPRVLKFIILPFAFFLDSVLLKLKPKISREKFALGLFFVVTK